MTAYSLWKQESSDKDTDACLAIEKNTKSFSEWKLLEGNEKLVFLLILISFLRNAIFFVPSK